MKKNELNLKYNSGITLIALIITIIVLLILAGVSISVLFGENGIIGRASSAAEATRGGTVREESDLWKMEVKLAMHTDGIGKTSEEKIKELLERGLLKQEEYDELIDIEEKYNGESIIIGGIETDFNIDYEIISSKILAQEIYLSETNLTLIIGNTNKLEENILPENTMNKSVTWTSSDESKVTVEGDGTITAISQTTEPVIITCSTNDGSNLSVICEVNVVLPPPITVTSVALNKISTSIAVGGTETLIATVLPNDAADTSVTWSSNAASIATVNSTGKITASSTTYGTATIRCTANDGSGKSATCTVTVYPTSIVHLKAGDYVNYTPPSQNYTMTTTQTGYTSNQTYSTSKYAGKWQVLYDNATYGRVEIISSDNILANDTSKVLYLSGKNGYNNIVSTLNTMSNYYKNTTYATDARSVGSNPTNKAGISTYYTNASYSYIATYAPTMITSDTTYSTDITAMTKAGVKTLSTSYWLAAREIHADAIATYFRGGCLNPSLGWFASNIVTLESTGSLRQPSPENGVRPVLSLKPSIQVVDSGAKVGEKTIWNLAP